MGDAAAIAELDRSRQAYADVLRRTNARTLLGIAGFLALLAPLPITAAADRPALLAASASLVAVIVLWFRIVPIRAFGEQRLLLLAALLHPSLLVLMVFSGGIVSIYFSYMLLPVLLTVYSPRRWHTAAVAGVTVTAIVIIAMVNAESAPLTEVVRWAGNKILMTLVFAALIAVAADALRVARRDAAARASDLARAGGEALRIAHLDPLSGLFNRYYGDEMLERLVSGAQPDRPLSALAIDIDDMKGINDRHGHAAGDAAIVAVATLLRKDLRGMDVPIRTGGDEFVVLLPATNAAQAGHVVERIQLSLHEHNAAVLAQAFQFSTGAAEWFPGMTGRGLLAAADQALYAAKRGKHRRDDSVMPPVA